MWIVVIFLVLIVVICLVCIVVTCVVCIFVVVLCVLLSSCVYLLYYVCIVVFTLDAGLLARSQYSEGPATGHLDTGFSWFPCVYKQMLRRFPTFQVATTCFSCSPPDLNLLDLYFIFMYMHNNHCHRATANWQLNILLLLLLLIIIKSRNHCDVKGRWKIHSGQISWPTLYFGIG